MMTHEYENASLGLACLKENFEYQEFFQSFKKDPFAYAPALPQEGEDEFRYADRIKNVSREKLNIFIVDCDSFNLNWRTIHYMFANISDSPIKAKVSDIIALLDPYIDTLSSNPFLKYIPKLFKNQAVAGIFTIKSGPFQYGNIIDDESLRQILKPKSGQRFLTIDMNARKSELMAQFEQFIDNECERQKVISEYHFQIGDYRYWIPDKTRQRQEAWKQLEVWKLRRKRISFKDIALQLRITQDRCKKQFYRAWELTQHKVYSSELFAGIQIDKASLPKSCNDCIDKQCLGNFRKGREWIPCPDVARYVMQDQVSLRETLGKKMSVDLALRNDGRTKTNHIDY